MIRSQQRAVKAFNTSSSPSSHATSSLPSFVLDILTSPEQRNDRDKDHGHQKLKAYDTTSVELAHSGINTVVTSISTLTRETNDAWYSVSIVWHMVLPARHGEPDEPSSLGLHEAPYSFRDVLIEPPQQNRTHHHRRVDT